MIIENFNKEIIDEYTTFFVLQHIGKTSEEITIFLKKIEENKVYEDNIKALRLPDNNILICFNHSLSIFALNNLVASDGIEEEIINLQIFERIKRYYDNDPTDSVGGFLFHDSIPVWNAWRCHYDKYGPETFMKDDEDPVPLIDNLEDLYVYEPIFSINSVAHLIYIHANVDENYYLNQDPFPRTSKTLQGNLKQIIEWSDVTEEPWNNPETIASRAKNFIDKLKFSEEFKNEIRSTQPDMQVFKYLSGDPDAKVGTDSFGLLTQLINNEVLKRVAHLSLSNLINIFNINISEEDKNYILQKEIEKLQAQQSMILEGLGLDFNSFDGSQIEAVKIALKNNNPEAYGMYSIFVEVFGNYKDILDLCQV